jgi:hypothetical protein
MRSGCRGKLMRFRDAKFATKVMETEYTANQGSRVLANVGVVALHYDK